MNDRAQSPAAYSGFESQPIGGKWRPGRSDKRNKDTNPYNGETLVEIPLATAQDVDDAYEAAAEAQKAWAGAPPAERARVLHNVVRIFDERREEIVSWLIGEAGSTRLKAHIEAPAASRSRPPRSPIALPAASCLPTSTARRTGSTAAPWV